MKRKIVLAVLVGVLSLSIVGCGWHPKNDMNVSVDNASDWFEETGIEVKNSNSSRVYKIIKDKYGWLYYSSSASEELEAVRDVDGNMTKDISIFEE